MPLFTKTLVLRIIYWSHCTQRKWGKKISNQSKRGMWIHPSERPVPREPRSAAKTPAGELERQMSFIQELGCMKKTSAEMLMASLTFLQTHLIVSSVFYTKLSNFWGVRTQFLWILCPDHGSVTSKRADTKAYKCLVNVSCIPRKEALQHLHKLASPSRLDCSFTLALVNRWFHLVMFKFLLPLAQGTD